MMENAEKIDIDEQEFSTEKSVVDFLSDNDIGVGAIEPKEKKGITARFKGYLDNRSQKKTSKKEEKTRVATVLSNIDTHLDSLAAYNATLIEEVENLRKNNDELMMRLEKMRKREWVSKIIAAVSGIVSIVLVILKIFGIM